jgi:hypothetical protein
MPATYEPISTQTLGSAVQTVTFSSIPSTYTDLVVVVNAFSSVGGDLYVSFNGDSAANYSRTIMWGDGTSAGSLRNTRADGYGFIILTYYGSVTTTQGGSVHTVNIMNYSNTTTNKTVLARPSSAGSGVDASVGMWNSTAAITSMTFDLASTRTFSAGSTFTLYGIKAAA